MNLKSYLLSIFCFFIVFVSSAQNSDKEIVNLTQGDGLPSNECYFIFRDSKNFLWIATDQGVIRYSGTTITNYALSDNIVFKIKEDEEGNVWFFTKSGMLSYFQNGKVYPYQYNDSIQKYCKNLLILNAFFTKDGGIHFNTIGKFNYDISKNGIITKQYYQADESSKSQLKFQVSENAGDYIAVKNTFTSAITIEDSLCLQFKGILNDSLYTIPFNQTSFYHYGARKIKDGVLFFNSKDLIKINKAGGCTIKRFDADILSVKADSTGNIGVGLVKGGAYKLDNNLDHIQPPLLQNKSITSIEFDNEGGVWFSTLESGVYYLKYSLIHPFMDESILKETIFRTYNYRDSILFFANKSGIFKIENKKVTSIFKSEMVAVNDLFIDDDNLFIAAVGPEITTFSLKHANGASAVKNIFIFSSAHEILKFAPSKYLINFSTQLRLFDVTNLSVAEKILLSSKNENLLDINKLFLDKNRNLWGMSWDGLYKLKSYEDSIGILQKPVNYFAKGVTSMGQLTNGYIIVGLRFGGIAVMQDTTVKLIIKEENGLVNNSVKCIYVDGMNVWVGTSNGISLISFDPVDILKFHITNIEKSNGLSNAIIYQLTKFKDVILAATNKGILSVNMPELLLKRNVPVLPFYISNISWYKGDTSGISNISLPYNYNSLTVRYTCISFNSPEDVEYYYRISNIDTSWKSILGKELVLQNLSPGTYKLEIKAALNNQRRYSETRKITIYVEKPWWQYNLVRILFFALVLYLAFFIYKRREKKLRIKVQHENDTHMKMGALEQSALRSQMNPHFIFNCLTSIQQMIVSGKNTEANKYLVKFSRLIRSTLDLSSSAFISIADERNYLSDYIALEQLRLVERIKYNFVIDDKINSEIYEIPSMILQPIIENSIRHGLKNLDKQGEIDISMVKEDDHLKCIITDNGHGLNELKSIKEHKSHALQNISQRLQAIDELNNTHATYFKVTNKVDDEGNVIGTMTIIKMPFKIKSK